MAGFLIDNYTVHNHCTWFSCLEEVLAYLCKRVESLTSFLIVPLTIIVL